MTVNYSFPGNCRVNVAVCCVLTAVDFASSHIVTQ